MYIIGRNDMLQFQSFIQFFHQYVTFTLTLSAENTDVLVKHEVVSTSDLIQGLVFPCNYASHVTDNGW